jgi:hypothetical protein
MALCWRHEPNRAVPVLMVIPMNKATNPLPCRQQAVERRAWIGWPVFQGLEQRLREGNV